MAEFEAKITGIADLSKAKQDFETFKKSMEQPIKITVDASGFNAVWGNLQKQAQSVGSQAGRQYAQGFEKNIAAIDTTKVANNMLKGIVDRVSAKNGKGSLTLSIFGNSGLKELGASSAVFKTLEKELDSIRQKGLQIQSIKFNETGTSFVAKAINDMGTLVTLTSKWKEAVAKTDRQGNFLGVEGGEWKTNIQYLTDFTAGTKQAQQEADRLAQDLEKVGKAFSNGDFSANVATMTKQLNEISDTVSQNLVQKATNAANEYKTIVSQISSSLSDPTQPSALQGQDLVNAYKNAEDALKRYRNAMKEVRADTTKMFAEGANVRAANDVEAWARKNSRALKQYGEQLEILAQQMRQAKSAGELSSLQNQFKNLKSEINAAGLGGLTFGDQLKHAFSRISQYTGIYAITSQVRQLPSEMVKEVISIDTAMNELRKVSTASASEISDYFDRAADSAHKYGQTINEVIDSTASWTRLGYNLEDASILTDVTAELAQVGSGLDTKSATEGLQATIRGFGLMAEDAKYVGDLINEVADTQPIDALGIINGLERSSAVMRETNNSLEEAVGLITATTSVTQDATSAGTAWRTVALRITGAKSELEEAGLETDGMVESTAKLRDYLLQVAGIDILDATGKNFKSTYQIMSELAQVWGQLSGLEKSGILDKIAGKRGSVAVSSALQNWNIAESAKNTALNAEGSMDRQLAIYNESIQASINKFKVAFQELSADLISSDFIKGVVDTGTTVIKIIDELVKHVGILGTAITGLGLTKILFAAKRGASDITHIGDAVSLFSGGIVKNLGDAKAAFSLLWDEIAVGANGAGDAIVGLLSNVNPVMLGITGGLAAAFAVYKLWKGRQEEIERNTSRATDSWNKNTTDIEQYKQQYASLNKQLENANLTEAQRIDIKQQLLNLQNEINSKYGEQAGNIDLVNGGLETQLGLLTNISSEEARKNLRDNKQGYEKAKREMEKTRDYRVDNPNLDTGEGTVFELSKSTQEAYNKIFDPKYWKNEYGTFVFKGDASQFETEIQKVMNDLENLKDTVDESDKNLIQQAINSAQEKYEANAKVLEKYQDNYNAYREQKLYDDGFGDELAKYSRLVQEYNNALFSEDSEKINEAKTQLDEYRDEVEKITSAHKEYGDFFDEVANSVQTTTEKVYQFKDVLAEGATASSNDLRQYESQIKSSVNNLKGLGLDGVDIQNILLNGGVGFEDLSALAKIYNPDFDFSEDAVRGFADFLAQIGVVATGTSGGIDLAKDSFEGFMQSASASIDTIDKVNASLVNSFKSGGLSARIDAETGKLTGDVKTIMDAYSVDDASEIFERTADGIILNRDALRELQSQQEKTIKEEFVNRIAEAQKNYNDALNSGDTTAISYWKEQLDNVQLLASAYDGATSAYQKWLDAQKGGEAGDQYDQVVSTALKRGKELYDKGLVGTNEFRAIAQLYSNEDLSTASIDDITKAYEDGVTTVKKYFTAGQEGAVAFADKLVELGHATKDANGEYDFYDGIDTQKVAEELGISVDLVESAFKKLSDYGFDIHFNFSESSVEDIRAQLKAWSDGGNVDLNVRPVIDTDLLKAAGWEDAGEGAATLFTSTFSNEAGDIAMNFTPIMTDENGNFKGVLSPEELTRYAEGVISGVREDDLNLKIGGTFEGDDAIQQADEFAEKFHEAHEELLVRGEFEFDDGELNYALNTATALKTRIDNLNNLHATTGVDVDIENDDQVRQLSEDLLSVDDKEIRAKFGVDGINDVDGVIEKYKNGFDIPANITADTSGVQTPTDTTASVDYKTGSVEGVGAQTAVLNYVAGTIPPIPTQTAMVDYSTNKIEKVPNQEAKINYSNGYIEDVPDQSATINYTASISGLGALPDDGEHRTIYIRTVELYKGTVSKSAFQAMSSAGSVTSGSSHANGTLGKVGLKHDETALINELGSEIVVRPSEDSWMIFNDGKPTFAPLKKGDVIFNADLTRQLLEKGEADDYTKILSGNSHSRGTVKGIARATVKGGGSFKKASSSSKKSSGGNGGGGNGGGGGGSSNSKANKEANDFKETLDKIEIRIDRLDRSISNLDTVASNTFNNWTTRNKALADSLYNVSVEIKEQQRAYNRYIKQANKVGLSAGLAAKVRSGEIDIQDIRNEDTWKKIEEYRKWYEAALDARDAIYKLKVDEADLWNQRFELNQNFYENQIDQYQHLYDQFDSYIELAENTGRISANKYRLRQIDEENKKLKKLREEYNALRSTMNSALASGKIKAGSEGYYEMIGTLNEISENMADVTANIAELNKSIRETNWEIFDKGAETISKMNDELEFLYGLLGDEDKMFDDKGIVNDAGITGFGILSAQYNVAMKESQKYASEIKKINKELAKDPYNQDLIERRQELYDSQRKAIEGANDYKDSIVDLVEEGIKKQIDSLKDLISNYTDLIDTQKDEIDYAKKVADAQNNVNKIQKQLNAYANDDTEEGASKRQKLRNDLKNAQDNLAQTEEDRRMSQTKKLLSDLQGEYEDILNARLDDVDALIRAVIDGVDANASIIKTSVETAAKDVGYIMTGDVATIFNSSIVKDLASYFTNGSFVENVTSISDSVKGIENYITSAQRDANTKASNNLMANKVLQTGTHIQSYTDSNGKTKVGYFNDDGTRNTTKTGWAAKDGKVYRFNNGELMKGSQFVNVDGKKYRLDSDGSRATNTWRKVGNNLYYFNKDGQALTGLQTVNGKKFYFDKNGVNRRGLQTVGSSRYYFNSKNGAMESNVWRQVGNGLYYFGSNGKAASGWFKTSSGKWFFFDPKTNKRLVNQWIHGSTVTTKPVKGDFYVDANGLRVANGKKKTNRGWLTFDANGKWKGYKTGTRSVGSNGLYWTNEGAPETIIRKSDGAVLTKLNAGDTVLNNNATQNMWDFANNPQKFLKGLGVNNTYGSGNNVNLEFNLSGLRSPSEFMDALRKDKRFEKLIQEMTLGRVNGHGSLAKNAIKI